MPANSSIKLPVIKVSNDDRENFPDSLAVEEPLEIRLEYGPLENRQVKNISVTMRTPGNDAELAVGFLFTEGILKDQADVISGEHCFIACDENKENVIVAELREDVTPNLSNAERNFYTTSSCGVCGKASISAIKTVSVFESKSGTNIISAEILYKLPETLKQQQQVFADTGGLHASALFDQKGQLLLVREDVGRHNALDKLIGAALNKGMLPLDKHILLLSGRASFELVQKAAMAGINIIAAVGAPSSLAVQLAEEFNITLIGFLRGRRFNIYTAASRVLMNTYEDTY
ncbi:MAG TPA: formate dehydrogenase accessory sulfurtransferase FdhD [Mucilaginibacter sp.]|jgi:FdhD protein|nr:formate dehydrogenase accessory sulfurtransferase FdhD [Mucilaginibacter sp.]